MPFFAEAATGTPTQPLAVRTLKVSMVPAHDVNTWSGQGCQNVTLTLFSLLLMVVVPSIFVGTGGGRNKPGQVAKGLGFRPQLKPILSGNGAFILQLHVGRPAAWNLGVCFCARNGVCVRRWLQALATAL